MKKGVIFAIHSIAGLFSGIFILLLSLSGALLVFHDELDHLQYPSVVTENDAKRLSIDNSYKHLQEAFPHAQISNCDIPEARDQPFRYTIYDSSYQTGTKSLQVFLHPQTGKVLKTRGSKEYNKNIMNWIAGLHTSFHLKKKGEWLLGFFGLVFLLSVITGIILFRKNLWAAITFRKKVFKKGNFHQLIGTYALLFNLMIAFTGFWMQRYVFKKEFYKSYDYTPVLKPSPALFFSMDSAIGKLHRQYPDFTGYVIYFAQSKKGKTALYGNRKSNSFIHSKKFADMIALDSTGNVASTRFVNEISSADRYDIISSQIHFGKYGGLPVKIIYFLFGLASSALSITGFLLWKRRKNSRTGSGT